MKIWLDSEELILFPLEQASIQEYTGTVFLCAAGCVFIYIGKTTNMKKLSVGEAKSPNAIGLAAQHFYIINIHSTVYNRRECTLHCTVQLKYTLTLHMRGVLLNEEGVN